MWLAADAWTKRPRRARRSRARSPARRDRSRRRGRPGRTSGSSAKRWGNDQRWPKHVSRTTVRTLERRLSARTTPRALESAQGAGSGGVAPGEASLRPRTSCVRHRRGRDRGLEQQRRCDARPREKRRNAETGAKRHVWHEPNGRGLAVASAASERSAAEPAPRRSAGPEVMCGPIGPRWIAFHSLASASANSMEAAMAATVRTWFQHVHSARYLCQCPTASGSETSIRARA